MRKKSKGGRTATDITLQDTYKFYKLNFTNPVKMKVFNNVIQELNSKLVSKIYLGLSFPLPYSLGRIQVIKFKPKYQFLPNGQIKVKNQKRINWKETNKYNLENPDAKILILYENDHTDGYTAKISWEGNRRRNLSFKAYTFKPCREFARGLARYIKTTNNFNYQENDIYNNSIYSRKTK